jgi:hypothetical protein
VVVRLHGNELLLNLRQQQLRFRQRQTQIGDLTKTLRPTIGITSKLRNCPSAPVPTIRSVHSIHESPAGNIPDRSYRSLHDPPINGRSPRPPVNLL